MTEYVVHPNLWAFGWWKIMRGNVLVAVVRGEDLAQRIARLMNEDGE
jgi:hypothetical protein